MGGHNPLTPSLALADLADPGQWTELWIMLPGTVFSFGALSNKVAGLKDMPASSRL